ncbi:MAG: Ig-like domain-containing protein [Parcubacteria group bacterium]|nr:Ig-like domain-containing protein [Parcubacteria group bacterium]
MSLSKLLFQLVSFISLSTMLFIVKANAQQASGISVSPAQITIQERMWSHLTVSLDPPFPHQQVNVNLSINQVFGLKMKNGNIFYPLSIYVDRAQFTTSPLNPGFAQIHFFARSLPSEFQNGAGTLLAINARTSDGLSFFNAVPIAVIPYQNFDRKPPEVKLLSPNYQQRVNRYAPLTVKVDAKDDIGISAVDVYWDNKLVSSLGETNFDGIYSMPIPAPIEPGVHMIHAIAHDFFFNFTVSSVVLVTVL